MSNLLSTTWERVYFKDPLSRFLFVSAGWIEAYAPGRDPAELRGKTDFDVFTQEHASAAFADEQQIIRTGEPVVERVERETYTGRPDAWVSTTKMALRNERGEIIGTFGITRDISAQIMAENALARQADELSAQNEQLRELDQLKDEFVALVSHELRTPLTSIIGYIELLRDERAAGMDADHFARVIQRNAERLLHLVGDLLFLSQIQTGKLALEVCDTHLADIAAEAVQEMRPDAGQKNIELTLSAAVDPHLPVDPTRMAQLLGNLISNAVKFTPEDGKVEVTLAVEGNEAVLSVADTGIGIPAADQEQIFERFFRTEAATRRMIPGSGLGLTISRAIVDAHQGTITVRSDEDHGSTFTVRLPLASASRPAPGAAVTGDAALPVRPYRQCGVTSAALEVMRLGQRPAAGRQVGPDPGDVGVEHLLMGDGPNGLADRRRGLGVALVGEFVSDLADLGVGELTAQQREQRDVVHIGNTFGVARTQPVDDRAQEGWQRHASERNAPTRLSTPERATATRGGSAPVAIEVAIALPVSWNPLVKSKHSAVMTTRARSRSFTAIASRPGIGVSRGVTDYAALCQLFAIFC
jgi:PAS domain S-box-containing protein